MFRRLKIKLITINLVLICMVLAFVFIGINLYMMSVVTEREAYTQDLIEQREDLAHNNENDPLHLLTTRNERDFLGSLQTITLISGGASVILALFISFILANRALRPVKEAWENQQAFVADASHELRTPLAVLHTNLDAVMDSPDETVAEQEQWLVNMQNEIVRLSKLTNELLFLARADAKSDCFVPEPFFISDTFKRTIALFAAVATEKGLAIEQDIQTDIKMNGIESRISQLLMILLDNAVKNTPHGGKISVSLHSNRSDIVIKISDTGVGISEEHLSRIFDRFYKADTSRSQDKGGSGLGLAIAKHIVTEHKGTIEVHSRPKQGTMFTISFPT